MLDLNYFRANFESVATRLATRGPLPQLDQFRDADKRRRAAISKMETLKAQNKELLEALTKGKK